MVRVVGMVGLLLWMAAAQAGEDMALTQIEVRPLEHVRDGRVQGCGLRFTVGAPAQPSSAWLDVSVNVFRRGIGLAQAILYEIGRSEYDGESRPATVPVQRAWVKAPGVDPRVGEALEQRESLIYRMVAEDVLALFEATARGEPVVLGIKRWGASGETVHTGVPVMPPPARAAVSACLETLEFE